MPNHASNMLTITGPEDEVTRFRKQAVGYGPAWDGEDPKVNGDKPKPLDLNRFVPVPVKVLNAKKDASSDAFNSGGYDWVCNNWGTKWGCYDTEVDTAVDGTRLTYRFQTAWSPFNANVLVAMSTMFPKLEFELKFAEMRMGFYGCLCAKGGEITEEASGRVTDADIEPNTGEPREGGGLDRDYISLLGTSG